MATPQELLQAAKGGARNVMVNRPARRPLGIRGGRMPNDPMAKPGIGSIDARPSGPRLETGGGIVGAVGAAPPKRPWQILREAGLPGTGSAAGNREAAAKLAAGGAGGSGPIVDPAQINSTDRQTTDRTPFPGFKPAGGGPIFQGLNDSANQLSTGPGIRPPSPAGGIVPSAPPGGGMSKEMPGGMPDEGVKAMPMPSAVPAPPSMGTDPNARQPLGSGGIISDPNERGAGGNPYEALGRVGAGLRRQRPMGDFGPVSKGPEQY